MRSEMSTLQSVMADLESKGSEKTCIIYSKHGNNPKSMYGVSNADLKVIAKAIKGQQALACELYATGNFDAMYLAGIVADGAKMTREQMQSWADGAEGSPMIYEYSVPWVAVDHPNGRELALEWINSKKEHIASAGWRTYVGLLTTQDDSKLNLKEIEDLLAKVVKEVHTAENRVRSTMNTFVISVGTYVKPLLEQAKAVAKQIGNVSVDVGDTACKIPVATEYIAKAEASGKVGQKRKTIRC